MSIFDKKRKKENKADLHVGTSKEGNSIILGNTTITFVNSTVGVKTGSTFCDFYVYEWYIKETGEVFYVGKGRGNRYKEFHESAYEAEEIRKIYDTDVRFVAENLTEEQALSIESQEMTRLLNETNDCLANRITPFFTKRDSGFSRSSNTPPFKFETAPILYATEIEEHYFNIKGRPFDPVDAAGLACTVIIDKGIDRDIIEVVYGGKYEQYYGEVVSLLQKNNSKIMKSRTAKSVTSWIYPGDDFVTNYNLAEERAEEKLGRRVPAYHLLDVWKYLKEIYGEVETEEESIEIHPCNDRVPLDKIKNQGDWDAGFDAGFPYYEKAEDERKAGNIAQAIKLYDKARYNGYFVPALYNSYASAYRKEKDYDNEIAILQEGIERMRKEERDCSQVIVHYEEQIRKAKEKLLKQRKQKGS